MTVGDGIASYFLMVVGLGVGAVLAFYVVDSARQMMGDDNE